MPYIQVYCFICNIRVPYFLLRNLFACCRNVRNVYIENSKRLSIYITLYGILTTLPSIEKYRSILVCLFSNVVSL